MIEVFKTNVEQPQHATMLVEQIHRLFTGYRANFDLSDCDRVLRVQASPGREIQPSGIIALLNRSGFHAEVLPDLLPAVTRLLLPVR